MIDAEVISSLIGMIYDAALDPNGWPVVLERISDLVGGGPGSLFLAAPQVGIRYTPVRIDESALADYAAHFRQQDFMQPALAGLDDPRFPALVGVIIIKGSLLIPSGYSRGPGEAATPLEPPGLPSGSG